MKTTVHVFAGTFASREAATDYTEERPRPEPDESASDEEWEAWEEAGPAWDMLDDLGVAQLDHDFPETIHGEGHWTYLGGMLRDDDALTEVRRRAGEATTLVLVFEDALDGDAVAFSSMPSLTYCGRWAAHRP